MEIDEDIMTPIHVFRVGLAGFFPLHPMTVTEAERRRKAASTEGNKTDIEDAEEKQTE